MDTQINHIHYDIQRTRMDINRVTIRNEQLNAQISELSQYSRIIEIATARGLEFNAENIVDIHR
jgi:cell division protein FtsL